MVQRCTGFAERHNNKLKARGLNKKNYSEKKKIYETSHRDVVCMVKQLIIILHIKKEINEMEKKNGDLTLIASF